ncbi:Uncharacterized protein Fot_33011 [Forsythia ovata]|uniref:Uncharacterized protein n=1 Tax=Forsythia ovata TaxID=205694 RepID=A0ABD1T9J9_9LAMI
MEKNLEVDSSEYQPMVSQICKSRVPDAVIDTAHGALSLKSTELLPLLLCSKVENDSSSACNQEDSSIQDYRVQMEETLDIPFGDGDDASDSVQVFKEARDGFEKAHGLNIDGIEVELLLEHWVQPLDDL